MTAETGAARPHERLFWRRLAHWGASRGPEWWVRYSPPVFGAAAAVFVPDARRAALRNLRRVRGKAPALREARDVLATFASYASCIAEVLGRDAEERRPGRGRRRPSARILGERHVTRALAERRGVVLVTAHTAGWESAGPLFAQDLGVPMLLVMAPEADARAMALHDRARERSGVAIAHVVARDPLASLAILRHLRAGGVAALQIDRVPPAMRTRDVELLGAPGVVPEGPLRLAQLSGAPLLPIFCAREAHRRYVVQAFPPVTLARDAGEPELDRAAQHLATSMTTFLRAHPTQWFHWT